METIYDVIHSLLTRKLDHLIAHYGVVGGDKEVVEAAKVVKVYLVGLVKCLKGIVSSTPDSTWYAVPYISLL